MSRYWREFIVTSYPELARQYAAQQGFTNIEIEEYAGKIEGLWRVIPNNYAVVDITETGTTARENELTMYGSILFAQLVLYENAQKIQQNTEFAEKLAELKKRVDTIRSNQ